MRTLRENLLVRFSLASFCIMAAIAIALALVLSDQIRSDAVADLAAEAVGHASGRLIRELRPEDLNDPMTGDRYQRFDEFVQRSIVSDRTARVKLWARDGTVIYSDDVAAIGQRFTDNLSLNSALAGKGIAQVSIPSDPENTGETSLGTLMEVYAPIIFEGDVQALGAFEIYQYYGPTLQRIEHLRLWTFGSIAVGFVVLYGSLVSIVWGGWRTIVRQRSHLEEFNTELEEQVQERTKELTEARDRLQAYSDQVEELAVLQERNRLARELHDSVTQDLYGQTMYAEAAARNLSAGDTQAAQGNLQLVRDATSEAIREMRLLIFELQPPLLKDGLIPALQARLEAVERRASINAELTTNLAEGQRLPSEIEDLLYRIAREALNNVLKHAQARNLWVNITVNGNKLVLDISDDGIGFDRLNPRHQGGFGLKGIEERVRQLGGTLTVDTARKSGTSLKIEVDNVRSNQSVDR